VDGRTLGKKQNGGRASHVLTGASCAPFDRRRRARPTKCAWCKEWIGEAAKRAELEKVNYVMCPDCLPRELASVRGRHAGWRKPKASERVAAERPVELAAPTSRRFPVALSAL